jgi:hypothetical protein
MRNAQAHQLVELQEAANVLGNEDNLRVYLGKVAKRGQNRTYSYL